jgi:hypothetical protein
VGCFSNADVRSDSQLPKKRHGSLMLARITLFFLYKVAPLATFLVIVLSEQFRMVGLTAFVALSLFFLWRGRDYQGNPTLFGIRRDSSFFGTQRRADEDDRLGH